MKPVPQNKMAIMGRALVIAIAIAIALALTACQTEPWRIHSHSPWRTGFPIQQTATDDDPPGTALANRERQTLARTKPM